MSLQEPKSSMEAKHREFFEKVTLGTTYGSSREALRIRVNRSNVFEDSYEQIRTDDTSSFKQSPLNIAFEGEPASDLGGLTREWYTLLFEKIFDADYGLFKPCPGDPLRYQPNPASRLQPEHLHVFKFVGAIIGKAICDKHKLHVMFTLPFYKQILRHGVDQDDIKEVDPEFWQHLSWMLEHDARDLHLTFSTHSDQSLGGEVVDLKKDGRNIAVDNRNKRSYVKLMVQYKLEEEIREQIDAFRDGFESIIPHDLTRNFDAQDLQQLMFGNRCIDINYWESHTVYKDYTLYSSQIRWFWKAIKSFTDKERANVLRFATGSATLPSYCSNNEHEPLFSIYKSYADITHLPIAHTCYNQLQLPEYSSYEILVTKLRQAIADCDAFGFD